jgi:predicted ABC-type ATPase
MLKRIDELLAEGADFAFETTLSTKTFVSFIKEAQSKGYKVTLLYFWLESPEMAYQRVAARVSKGGHNIPVDVIERRYYRGIKNLFGLYIPICDRWIVVNNTSKHPETVAKGGADFEKTILNNDIWDII